MPVELLGSSQVGMRSRVSGRAGTDLTIHFWELTQTTTITTFVPLTHTTTNLPGSRFFVLSSRHVASSPGSESLSFSLNQFLAL